MGQGSDEDRDLVILRSAVENTNEAFVTIDQNHKVLFFNKAAEKMLGYGRDEVIGHDLDVIMTSECALNHRIAVERYVKTRVPKRIGHSTEFTTARKNGEVFPANISFSVSEVGGRFYFTGVVTDLTETKALQEKIQRSERLTAVCQVVPEITHEIKNPLMMIGGFVNQLIRQTTEGKNLTKLTIIRDEVLRLENLLKELRELYMTRTLNTEEVDLNLLLQEVYSLTKDDCDKKNIRTEFRVYSEPIIVQGDRAKLKQVFLNLVKNSIEAMETGGNLTIESRLNGNMVETTIKDDGIGIPEHHIEKIFSPFFTTKSYGTGLGLSVCKNIIEDHEGSSFTLKSEEGEGTTFTVSMPLYRSTIQNSIAPGSS